jgi:hypothetical protein
MECNEPPIIANGSIHVAESALAISLDTSGTDAHPFRFPYKAIADEHVSDAIRISGHNVGCVG